MKQNSKIYLKWLIMVILVLTWGSSYILMKRGLEGFPSMQVAALRISITFIVLLPFVFTRLKKVPAKKLWIYIVSGLIGNGIPAFLFTQAQKGIDSQIAGILNSVSPLFTLIIGLTFFGLRSKWFNITGVFLGLAGALGLLSVGIKGFDENFSYGVYIIIATLLYATNNNIVKKYFKDTDALTITALTFVVIGILTTIYLFAGTDFVLRLENKVSLQSFGYISILAVIGTAIAGILFNQMIKISSVLFASSVTYIIPVVAIMWGIIDGEKFYPEYILWMILIFAGVFLVNRERELWKV